MQETAAFCSAAMKDGQVFSASIATEPKLTRDDYACKLQQVLLLYGVNVRRIRRYCQLGRSSMVGVLEGALRTPASAMSSRYRAASRPDSTSAPASAPGRLGPRSRCGGRPCQGKAAVRGGYARHRDHVHALDGSGALVGSAITAGVQLICSRSASKAAQLPAVAIDAKDEGILAEHGRCHARRRGLRCGVARGRHGRTLCGSAR